MLVTPSSLSKSKSSSLSLIRFQSNGSSRYLDEFTPRAKNSITPLKDNQVLKVKKKSASRRTKISDSTQIAGTTWEHMKDHAMGDDYTEQDWYLSLSTEEKKLIESLRTA